MINTTHSHLMTSHQASILLTHNHEWSTNLPYPLWSQSIPLVWLAHTCPLPKCFTVSQHYSILHNTLIILVLNLLALHRVNVHNLYFSSCWINSPSPLWQLCNRNLIRELLFEVTSYQLLRTRSGATMRNPRPLSSHLARFSSLNQFAECGHGSLYRRPDSNIHPENHGRPKPTDSLSKSTKFHPTLFDVSSSSHLIPLHAAAIERIPFGGCPLCKLCAWNSLKSSQMRRIH